MTITHGYCTVDELKHQNRLNIQSSDSYSDDMLENVIEAVSRKIDDECHRYFWTDADSDPVTDMYYTALNANDVFIDDLRTMTGLSVAIDNNDDGVFETSFDSDSYVAEPANASYLGVPFQKITIRSRSGKIFPTDAISAVKVSGHYGWSSVPKPINQACLLQSERLFKRFSTPLGSESMTALGRMTLSIPSLDPDVELLISRYIKIVWG